ncbi:signal transduction histidine kinase with PAS domain [Halalkaliarchaeum desulfuricum]|uniref:histidine kinase n=2 Tax=Halalkaliarchaeum desulfuricum TaxID=2055893 RepID=A0A343TMF1_9EURY|nr:signal transduction histidine kinase with PAS domain [Halalkaliarchaeum desulfuricum]
MRQSIKSMSSLPSRMRILHVDDDVNFAELTATFLEREDDRFAVETATSASEGLEVIADTEVDCVVSDYDMPGRNGIEFLESIRERSSELPFILFTGKGSEEVASDAISAGVTDYLQKERGTDQYAILANRIKNAVEGRRARIQRERQLDAIETAQEGISILDANGVFIFVNEAYADLYGYEREEMIGEHWELIYRDDDVEAIREQVLPEVERTGHWNGITTGLRADGTTFVEDHALARTEQGELVCTVRDVSTQREYVQTIETLHDSAEEILRAQTQEYVAEVVVETVADVLDRPLNGVWIHDERTDVLEPVAWTDRADELVGDPPTLESGHGSAWEAFDTGEVVSSNCDLLDETSEEAETELRSAVVIPIGTYGVLTLGSTVGDGVDGLDVSLSELVCRYAETAFDRIEREQELQRYETIIQSISDAVYTLDDEGRIQFVNDSYVEMKGISREELVGTKIDQWVDEGVLERTKPEFERIKKGEQETAQIKYAFKRATGERIPVELRFAPLPTFGGDETGRVGVIRDVTERKQWERELERQNERLDAFARVVSHDLKNPLSVADGRLELAREECDSDHLAAVDGALDRMDELIADLLTLAKSGEQVSGMEPCDLGALVDSCWDNVDTKNATLQNEVDATVRCDHSRVQQLLENLIKNAAEHGGEDVTITVGDLPDTSGFYVEDDGPGIPKPERKKVFESGYSNANGGTGFGLAIVDEIVGAHGWTVHVTEGTEEGTRFEIGVSERMPPSPD